MSGRWCGRLHDQTFSFSELSARIRALLRRSHLAFASKLVVDDLTLDRVERRVERCGRQVELTSKEFALLEYLMRNAGHRMTRTFNAASPVLSDTDRAGFFACQQGP